MRLTSHELNELNELTLSCVNSITSMGLCFNQAEDPELKSLLMRHYPYHVRDYNKKVEYLQIQSSQTVLPVPQLTGGLEGYPLAQTAPPDPVTPRTNAQTLNDREIATSYLLTLKRAGREYAWAAMEMADPELRSFVEGGFLMCSHHAHEVWQYMVTRGWYPLHPAPQIAVEGTAGLYNLVPEPAPAPAGTLM